MFNTNNMTHSFNMYDTHLNASNDSNFHLLFFSTLSQFELICDIKTGTQCTNCPLC